MTTQPSDRKMHLFAMPMGSGSHVASWRHPLASGVNPVTPAYFTQVAQIAERGLFDAVFCADAQGFRQVLGKDPYSRLAPMSLDPVTVLGGVAMLTSRIGLVATLSTSYNEPYAVARRMATLDIVSDGRAGWNVVTSQTENEAHNFGRDAHYGHQERYARAGEFVDVARGLWDTWEDDAILRDHDAGRYFDPEKVSALRHEGQHFKVEGPLTTGRPPQGHPVVVQAGSSPQGLDLAARQADAVFTSHPTLDSAVAFYNDLKARVAAAGRDPNSLRILTAIQPTIADSEADAKAISDELNALISPDLALGQLSMQFGGFDFSGFDPDGPLPPVPANNVSQGSQKRIVDFAAKESLSLIQVARYVAAGRTSHTIAGTGEQVADLLAEWFEAGAADGFVISAPIAPVMFDRFVDKVVPVLQQRGLYRTAYEGTTLRDHLGLARPAPRRTGIEPEIWQKN